jgi:hypothetical protein
MNERIQELEKQAWEFVDKTWNWANANNPSQATLFKTKFAELIVKECAELFDKNETEVKIPEHRVHNSIMIHFGLY